jgi:hypothetical protein
LVTLCSSQLLERRAWWRTPCWPTPSRIEADKLAPIAYVTLVWGVLLGFDGRWTIQVTEANCALSITICIMIIFNGLLLSANGSFMLVAPAVWYEFVPGVTDTGFFNQHFIRDIGIIQLFFGVAFGVGMGRPELRVPLWAAATLWLIAHAVFHLWEVAVGICAPSAIPRDFLAVTLPAIFGVIVTLWAIRHSRTRAMNNPQSFKAGAKT